MPAEFRIIDTGVREGRSNIAFDAALIELRQAGEVPDSIRFMSFPPTALIGRHQDLSREINLEYCAANGVGTVRRMTGGGAIYLDEGQLGWELVFHRSALGVAALPELTKKICDAAAAGLSKLGVDARFRPRNDIEVDGRKISGTGGFFDGDVLIFQGTVLVDLNPENMVNALNVPENKLAKRELDSAAHRIVTLKQLLDDEMPDLDTVKQALIDGFCESFDITAEWGGISAAEEDLARQYFDDEIGTEEFVADIDDPTSQDSVFSGSHTGPGGTIEAFVKLEGPTRETLQRALITGDFFVTPPRVILDLEAHLNGTRLDALEESLRAFFDITPIDMLSVAPDDFLAAVSSAVAAARAE
jgi:lipoate-protein ligase A